MIKEYPNWESLLGDQDLLNRMAGVYPENFTILPCEWNCFYYDWQEREGDHMAGRHPKTCPNPQCGNKWIFFINHISKNEESFILITGPSGIGISSLRNIGKDFWKFNLII